MDSSVNNMLLKSKPDIEESLVELVESVDRCLVNC